MSGRIFKGILLLLVLFVACFMASPISSGEHPWGSDRGGGDGDQYIPIDTTSLSGDRDADTGIVKPDSLMIEGGGGGDDDVVTSTIFRIITTVWSSIAAMI